MMDCGKCTIKSELSIPDHDDKRNLIVTSNKHSQSLCYKSVLFANKLKSSGTHQVIFRGKMASMTTGTPINQSECRNRSDGLVLRRCLRRRHIQNGV